MSKQLRQVLKNLSDTNAARVAVGLDSSKSQMFIQQQLDSISKNLQINVGTVKLDTSSIKQQQNIINQQLKSGINTTGLNVKVPFQFDLSDANAVKAEINKIVADITNNKGQLVKYKINVDDNGQATKALLTYRNELNEVTNATLKLKSVGKWYDANGMEHNIVKWSEGQKTLSQNIEATTKANHRQTESDNQVIRKKEELIAKMKLLNTQAEKAGISLNSDNQNKFNDLSIKASTVDDIKQLETYFRLARTEYQTFNAEISKGTHASSLEAMKNNLETLPQDIALIEAKFNSIKVPDNVKTQIEELKSSMESINTISDPQEKIAKYNEIVTSLKNLQKQYQVTVQEQRNLSADTSTMQGASALTNKIVIWMGQNRQAAAQYDSELKQIISDLQNCNNKADFSKLQRQFSNIALQVKSSGSLYTGFFNGLKSGIKDAFENILRYQLAYKVIDQVISGFKSMVNAVADLDKKLTEFNKVADLTSDKLLEFSDRAFDAADEVGRTGSDMIEAATEFKRAGYSLEDSLDMGKSALLMTNVADGITQTSDAASTLIAVLKGFNINESDIMTIVDKMNSVSNQSPVGFDNLADGLERVSGTMNQAGNSIDETIGLLTGGYAQLRNMEKVSTGLITISQRLRAIDEDGDEIDGLSAELSESFGKIGVAIEDSNGDLRSTYDILSDYAKIYPQLTSEQKQYYAELASGKRQVNVFNAIVQQIADVDKAIEQSKDSLGSAANENEIYRQSVEGLRNELKNEFQSVSKKVINSDWIKDVLSGATDLLKVFENIIEQDTIVGSSIGVLAEGFKDLSKSLKDITGNDGVAKLIKLFITYKTITKGVDIFNLVKGKKDNFVTTLKELDNKGYGFETKNKVRIILLDILNKAIVNEYLCKNPVKGISVKRDEEKDIKVLSVEEQSIFFDCCKGTFYDNLYVVAVTTGMRIGELAGLKWSDIDWNKKVINVKRTLVYQKYDDDIQKEFHIEQPKTKTSKRSIPINKQCEMALKRQYVQKMVITSKAPKSKTPRDEFKEFLFTTKFNTPLNSQTVCDSIKKIVDEINLTRDTLDEMETFSPHCFRHTFATRCFEAGIQPKTVQSYLGHATLQMTMDLYTKVMPSYMVNEMDKFSELYDNIENENDNITEKHYNESVEKNSKIVTFIGDSLVV